MWGDSLSPTRSLRFGKLTSIARIKGACVYVHWSVILIAAVILVNARQKPVLTLVGLFSYLGVLVVHECGHLVAAQRMGTRVYAIEIYPIFGITRFQIPWSRFDHFVIAWGGVLAQLVVATPLVAWVIVFGYTPFESVNALLAIMGFFSIGVAIFNLLPIAPLDGAIAWDLFPAVFQRAMARRNKRLRAGRGRKY